MMVGGEGREDESGLKTVVQQHFHAFLGLPAEIKRLARPGSVDGQREKGPRIGSRSLVCWEGCVFEVPSLCQ